MLPLELSKRSPEFRDLPLVQVRKMSIPASCWPDEFGEVEIGQMARELAKIIG